MSIAIVLIMATWVGVEDPPKPASPPAAAPVQAPAPAPAGPSFRLAFQHFDIGKQPIGRGEVVASRAPEEKIESVQAQGRVLAPPSDEAVVPGAAVHVVEAVPSVEEVMSYLTEEVIVAPGTPDDVSIASSPYPMDQYTLCW